MTRNPSSAPLDITLITVSPPWLTPEVHARIDSTNAELMRAPRTWRVVVADAQESGRGRLGRLWSTPPGIALAVSACVPVEADRMGWVPLVAGLAVQRAVAEVAGVSTVLKWPNDVLVPADGDRKLAGILCETSAAGVVVGTGLNVESERTDLPVDTATSLRLAGAPGVSRERLLTAYLTELATLVERLARGPEPVREDYRRACATVGREVTVHHGEGRTRTGTATAVDEAGRLWVHTTAGPYAVAAGDVVHVRPASA